MSLTSEMSALWSVLVAVLLFQFPPRAISETAEVPPPPSASVFLVGSDDGVNRTLLNDLVNTEVQVEPGQSIELECKADSTVQWSYRGIGTPEFAMNVAINIDTKSNKEVHKASLLISNANDKNTGLYVCSYAEFPYVSSSYHIFVPGPEIFVADAGRALSYTIGMSSVTIPCPVSEKKAKVTLRKVFFDNSLRNVDSPLATFDPKTGFKLNIRDIRDADGIYVCTGYYEGSLRLREYILRNKERNQTAVTFPDGDDVNPCLSYACPFRSVCRVNLNTKLPFCACRPRAGSSPATNCIHLCKSSQECPKSEKCQFSIEKQLKMCIHICETHKCAENAECHVDEQRGTPQCRCRRGFQGNGVTLCERIPFKVEDDSNSYCTAAKCGPNSQCRSIDGKVQCSCAIGTVGSYPDCRKACTLDTDCDRLESCTQKGICELVCADNMCAPKAECKVLNRKPMCLCPPGFTGRATEACYPSHFFSSRLGIPSDGFGEEETTTYRMKEFGNQDDDYEPPLKLSLPNDGDDVPS